MILQILDDGEKQCLREMRRHDVVSYHGLRERDIIECAENSVLGRSILEAVEKKREGRETTETSPSLE